MILTMICCCRRGCASRQTVQLSMLQPHPAVDCDHCNKRLRLWPDQVSMIHEVYVTLVYIVDLRRCHSLVTSASIRVWRGGLWSGG